MTGKQLPRGRTGFADPPDGYTKEEWASFSKTKRWRIRNPEKMKTAVANWVANNPEQRRITTRRCHLKREYGITNEQYDAMFEDQQGRCAICGTDKPTGKWKCFAVDHNHETGAVRALLCNECNRGIGLLKDSAELLRKAAEYLDSHS